MCHCLTLLCIFFKCEPAIEQSQPGASTHYTVCTYKIQQKTKNDVCLNKCNHVFYTSCLEALGTDPRNPVVPQVQYDWTRRFGTYIVCLLTIPEVRLDWMPVLRWLMRHVGLTMLNTSSSISDDVWYHREVFRLDWGAAGHTPLRGQECAAPWPRGLRCARGFAKRRGLRRPFALFGEAKDKEARGVEETDSTLWGVHGCTCCGQMRWQKYANSCVG